MLRAIPTRIFFTSVTGKRSGRDRHPLPQADPMSTAFCPYSAGFLQAANQEMGADDWASGASSARMVTIY
jgi:hypothetical protein